MAKSISRLKAREVERKFNPAIKLLSNHMFNTTTRVDEKFIGYKVPAGSFKDASGREWQIQAHAVLSKGHQIKKDEIVPVFRGWAIGVKIRFLIKYVIDWTFNS